MCLKGKKFATVHSTDIARKQCTLFGSLQYGKCLRVITLSEYSYSQALSYYNLNILYMWQYLYEIELNSHYTCIYDYCSVVCSDYCMESIQIQLPYQKCFFFVLSFVEHIHIFSAHYFHASHVLIQKNIWHFLYC